MSESVSLEQQQDFRFRIRSLDKEAASDETRVRFNAPGGDQ